MTSPLGTLRSSSDCGGPHTPTGKPPPVCTSRLSEARRSALTESKSDSESWLFAAETLTGATPSALEGLNSIGARAPIFTNWTGAVLVTVISNSLKTSYGFSADPSAVPGADAPPGPVPGGRAPLPGIALNTRATPGEASSRYLATNASHVRKIFSDWSESPNSTVRLTGPTSNSARAWNLGPETEIFAPRETEIVISPIQTSMVTPAEILA